MMMLSKPIALLFLLATFGTTLTFAFPSFSGANDGLEDLSARWWRDKPEHKIKVIQNPPPPPGPPKFTGTKLVNDRQHPWKPVKAGDIRGPCPALNALANHGVSVFIPIREIFGLTSRGCQYISRDGVASPSEIVNAVQEGSMDFTSVPR